MRIPTSAKAQLQRAIDLGHQPYIERQAADRLYFVCSCGVRTTRRRSEKAVRQAMAWHLGKVIGMGEDLARVNGGAPSTGQMRADAGLGASGQPPAPRSAAPGTA